MKILLDTHLLLWSADGSAKLPEAARAYIEEPANDLFFSAANLWEIAIKLGLGREDFQVDLQELRQGLLDNEYTELPVNGLHTLALMGLPPIHKDPFDRLLIAQAMAEGMTLLTADTLLARYPGTICLVQG